MDHDEMTETTVTTRVIRPYKIIATILVIVAIVLMLPVLISQRWITSSTYHQGLWIECYSGNRVAPSANPEQPAQPVADIECYGAVKSGWLNAARGFTMISLTLSVFGLLFASLALWKGRSYSKFFVLGGVILLFAAVCILIVLIIFPVKFMVEDVVPNRGIWELGWAWGLAFGVLILQIAPGLLYIFAPDKQEIYYQEKTYRG